MSATVQKRMTADEFVAWAREQPEGKRYELVAGEVVAMAPERAAHGRMKGLMYLRLTEAVRSANLPYEVFPDGMAVRVDESTLYEPDVMVRCGAPIDDADTAVTDPMIVIEVVSPSSHKRDSGTKLADYFRIPSVRHYLIVRTETPAIIHHHRDEAGAITTHIVRDGVIQLDPPGLVVTGLFAQ